jgi:ribosomal protein S18 acetylase RimI-like enzyme
MGNADLAGVLELRNMVRWCTSPEAFGLLSESLPSARWAVAAAPDGALADGALVGMVGAVSLGKIGILCHLAVHPAHRGQGLGTRLTRWAVSRLHSQWAEVVRLESTSEAEKLYEALGFRGVGRRILYRRGAKLKRLLAVGEGYRVSPLEAGDLPELYSADRWSFGGDRSALLAAIFQRHSGSGLLARDVRGQLAGYLFRSGDRLGPWKASTPEAARALLRQVLVQREGHGIEVMTPGSGPVHELLLELGFTGVPDRLRMELGTCSEVVGFETYGLSPYLVT